MNPPVSVAIIGAGRMGREHLRAFSALENVRVTGIFSRTRPRAEALAREFAVAHVADSVAELYGLTRAGVVVIAVNELAKAQVAGACFQFPWTVLLEKPPGLHVQDALAIRDAARRAGARVLVGLNRRFLGSTMRALREADGCRGTRFIHVLDQQSLAQAAALGHPPEVVRNWAFANSIHTIDCLRFFGRGRVTGADVVAPFDESRPEVVIAHIKFSSGDHGLYQGIWNAPGPWAVSVTCQDHRWEMRPLEDLSRQVSGRPAETVERVPEDVRFKPGFLKQAEAVVAVVRNQPSPAATLDDALETMLLVERIFGTISREASVHG